MFLFGTITLRWWNMSKNEEKTILFWRSGTSAERSWSLSISLFRLALPTTHDRTCPTAGTFSLPYANHSPRHAFRMRHTSREWRRSTTDQKVSYRIRKLLSYTSCGNTHYYRGLESLPAKVCRKSLPRKSAAKTASFLKSTCTHGPCRFFKISKFWRLVLISWSHEIKSSPQTQHAMLSMGCAYFHICWCHSHLCKQIWMPSENVDLCIISGKQEQLAKLAWAAQLDDHPHDMYCTRT